MVRTVDETCSVITVRAQIFLCKSTFRVAQIIISSQVTMLAQIQPERAHLEPVTVSVSTAV